ncbi:NADP-dependent oxidoreductase domain-containing protein [Gigaspora rosea]|uniref:NADP-dependent oxidoreductase domain-containing protein n=1 Tax=Gigaspora rosea TaxID=44941 RepID=A0A397V6A5_9GLOM|nr:NADP-dependent oxidoreductase domain-containing protein [Gigaspora rosea]
MFFSKHEINRIPLLIAKSFFRKYSTSIIVKTGQEISRLGFGSYRINCKVDEYKLALKKAINSGINVIDTSAHFESGESEKVIGNVLEKMMNEGSVSRKNLVVISKAGYFESIDTSTLPDTFSKINNKSAHSISPEFLQNQISDSLARLKLNKLDIFMLNNPERMLKANNKNYSMSHLHQDIERAFNYLDEEVSIGRIGGYGICSNAMAIPTTSDHISLPIILEKIPESRRHNFVAIQVPFNIFERDVIQRLSSQNYSLAEYSKQKDIFLFTNRPLNAITGGAIRPLVNKCVDTDASFEEVSNNLANKFQKLGELEIELNELFPYIDFKLSSKFIWAQILSENLNKLSQNYFATKYYLEKQVKPDIINCLESLSDYLKSNILNESAKNNLQDWITKYHAEFQSLSTILISYSYLNLLHINNDLDSIISTVSPSLYFDEDSPQKPYSPLSVKCLRINLANSLIGCTLVGMRKLNHVEDSILALTLSDNDITAEYLEEIYNCLQ